jgi:hypothetical protein
MTRPDGYAGTFLREIAMDFSLGLFKDAADGITTCRHYCQAVEDVGLRDRRRL